MFDGLHNSLINLFGNLAVSLSDVSSAGSILPFIKLTLIRFKHPFLLGLSIFTCTFLLQNSPVLLLFYLFKFLHSSLFTSIRFMLNRSNKYSVCINITQHPCSTFSMYLSTNKHNSIIFPTVGDLLFTLVTKGNAGVAVFWFSNRA